MCFSCIRPLRHIEQRRNSITCFHNAKLYCAQTGSYASALSGAITTLEVADETKHFQCDSTPYFTNSSPESAAPSPDLEPCHLVVQSLGLALICATELFRDIACLHPTTPIPSQSPQRSAISNSICSYLSLRTFREDSGKNKISLLITYPKVDFYPGSRG